MIYAVDSLIEGIARKGNPTALGLDTHVSHLPEGFIGDGEHTADAILRYNKALVDALGDIVPCVKVQIAYYEMLGLEGMRAFTETLDYARAHGLIVIVDAKRNDIGSTAEAYAAAYLAKDAPFKADFLTVNGYLGTDGVAPFLEQCRAEGGGIFVLARTSNPSSGELQSLETPRGPVFEVLGKLADTWGASLMGTRGYSAVGAVVGATYPEEGKRLRELLPHTFFLVPGYGAQGGTGKDIKDMFGEKGTGAVVNASRSLLTAHKKAPGIDFAEAARREAVRMRDDIMGCL